MAKTGSTPISHTDSKRSLDGLSPVGGEGRVKRIRGLSQAAKDVELNEAVVSAAREEEAEAKRAAEAKKRVAASGPKRFSVAAHIQSKTGGTLQQYVERTKDEEELDAVVEKGGFRQAKKELAAELNAENDDVDMSRCVCVCACRMCGVWCVCKERPGGIPSHLSHPFGGCLRILAFIEGAPACTHTPPPPPPLPSSPDSCCGQTTRKRNGGGEHGTGRVCGDQHRAR
jgi:hypothetical protein